MQLLLHRIPKLVMLANVARNFPDAFHANGKLDQIAGVYLHGFAAFWRDKDLPFEDEARFFVVISPWKFRDLFGPDGPFFYAQRFDLFGAGLCNFYVHCDTLQNCSGAVVL